MKTAKLAPLRTGVTALLIALTLLLTACDQGGGTTSGTQATAVQGGNKPTGSTTAGATPATRDGSVPANSAPTDTPSVGGAPTDGSAGDTESLQATIVAGEATALVLSDQAGGSKQTGIDLAKLDPCKLLTTDEVKSVMGNVPIAPRIMGHESYHSSCSYVEPTLEENSPRLFLSFDPIETWEMLLPSAAPVPGIGDEARSADLGGWRTLYVLVKNKVVVGMDIYPPDLEKAKQLVSKAIERLP